MRIVNGYSGVTLPSLPGGLISKPTLVWDIDAGKAGTHDARIAYQTGGMTWWADYNLTYAEPKPGQCRLDVAAWVTLVNQSGAAYENARLKLIAGDVQRAQPRAYPAAAPAALGRVAEMKAQGFEEKAFFEYHLYTLGRPTSLAQNSTKQIELFPTAAGVGCEKTLVYYGQGDALSGLRLADDGPQLRHPVQQEGRRVPADQELAGQRAGRAAAGRASCACRSSTRPTRAWSSSART